jgi:predicted transcriptional regulator
MKAIIGIANWGATCGELRELARQVDAGERLHEADYHLNFPDPLALLAALPPKRLATLRAIKANEPLTIYALAKRLTRNYSNVHADVQQLVELGLVEKDDDQRLIVPFDDIRVEADASLMAAA